MVLGFFKNLLLGPCRAHTNKIFILVLLFLSVLCSFVIKCVMIAVIMFSYHLDHFRDQLTLWTVFHDNVWPLLPQIFIAILALPSPMTITHPSLMLVPLFTWYTFIGSNSCYSKIVNYTKKIKSNCVCKWPLRRLWPLVTDADEEKQNGFEDGYQESFIRFSPGWTLMNIGFTVANAITYSIVYWTKILEEEEIVRFGVALSVCVPAMLLTCWFALNDKQGSQSIA